MSAQEGAQPGDLLILDGVWMDADGPHTARLFDGGPELLRNPGKAVANKGCAREAIGQSRNSLCGERFESVGVEPVAWSNPDSRVKSVAAKNIQPCSDPGSLHCCGHAGKFRGAVQAKKTPS